MAEDKIIKIAVIGAESTGKSTLCSDLARHYSTIFVEEYARVYFEKNDIENYKINDLENIYREQIKNEAIALRNAKRYLFCDTTLITAKIWAEEVFKNVPDYIKVNLTKVEYDLYLVSNNDIPWESDPQRKNQHNRPYILNRNIEELELLKAPYAIIGGLNSERVMNAIKHIDEHFKIKT